MALFAERTWDIDDIRRANNIRGLHFFERGTMRFFSSRIGQTVYQGVGGIYFVTSERGPNADCKRLYTVRQFNPATADVKTVGPFNELTRARAIALATKLSLGGKL